MNECESKRLFYVTLYFIFTNVSVFNSYYTINVMLKRCHYHKIKNIIIANVIAILERVFFVCFFIFLYKRISFFGISSFSFQILFYFIDYVCRRPTNPSSGRGAY